ncbi:MAG: hypothetical protein C0596_10385 [Marinilabiliales bacterium]|nr:MAG: hypothetical protein C0596_10385 [Marinilabiliales bacterium]
MKKATLTLLITIVITQLSAQVFKGQEASKIAPSSDIVRMNDFSKVPDFIHFQKSVNIDLNKAINYTIDFFDSDNLNIEIYQTQKNRDNEQTVRLFQTFNGIPIEFTRWHIQLKDNKVYAMNGSLLDQINVNPTFIISEETALQNALDYSNADTYMWESEGEESLLKEFTGDNQATYFPKAEKVIVPVNRKFNSETTYRTAYKFNIYSKAPHKRDNIYVDAQTGEILFEMPLIISSDEVCTAETVYSGTRSINTEYNGSNYVLSDNTRGDGVRTLNCEMGTDYEAATEFTDDDNYWDNVNADLDEYATDAQFATMSTYDYYYNIHGRNSIDGNGYQLWSFIHFDLIEYGYSTLTNAFWNGQWMTYGDGDDPITPLTTIDICAHEITHGLTSYTCNLNYQDESGAINEAFSDIFGASVEFYAVPSYADWTIGEDIGTTFRSLANPNATGKPDTYQGDYWVFGSEDYGGVHTNMSPLCYWFYLLSEGGSGTNDNGDSYSVTAIGRDKAEQIAFRLQTVYLTPTSEFHDAWFYAMQAAADLYGACSDEVQAVGDGFYAIGVADEPYVNEVHAGFTSSYSEACAPPLEVSFSNTSYNGDNFLWTFGDGSTSTEINPTHTYTDFGYFDVQLEVDGSACGSDNELIEDFIVIDESIPCLTLLPSSGNIIVEGCNGLIYDQGGPDGNYNDNSDGSITIYSPGSSSIVLTILEFNIEAGSGSTCDYDYMAFYDGNSTSSPLINSTIYCNTNGNPGTISSTGEYLTIRLSTDGGLNLDGFKIQYDCIANDSPPTALFSASPISSCNGIIEFTDNSLNLPDQWEWDFGDGTISNEENPTHLYESNGTYDVTLTVNNSYGENTLLKEDYIIINMPDAPILDPIQACSNTNFIIELDLEGEAQWYEEITDESPIYSGNTWDHDAITEATTYYIREMLPGEVYNVGATNNTTNGGYFGNESYIHYLVFDAYSPFILQSVEVNADGAGGRLVALRNSNQQIIEQKTVYCVDGVSRVTLNFDVPIGENLQLVGMGSPDLWRTNEGSALNYHYNIENYVSIKESSASTGPTDYYYYFYDWEISTYPCQSPFVPVELVPEECTSNITNKLLDELFLSPNPTNNYFTINGLELIENYQIILTDISGKRIQSVQNIKENKFSAQGMSPGVYFVSILSDDGLRTMKLVIQ